MSGWMVALSERYFEPLYGVMAERLRQADLVHADETPVVVKEDRKEVCAEECLGDFRGDPDNGRVRAILRTGKEADLEEMNRHRETTVKPLVDSSVHVSVRVDKPGEDEKYTESVKVRAESGTIPEGVPKGAVAK